MAPTCGCSSASVPAGASSRLVARQDLPVSTSTVSFGPHLQPRVWLTHCAPLHTTDHGRSSVSTLAPRTKGEVLSHSSTNHHLSPHCGISSLPGVGVLQCTATVEADFSVVLCLLRSANVSFVSKLHSSITAQPHRVDASDEPSSDPMSHGHITMHMACRRCHPH